MRVARKEKENIKATEMFRAMQHEISNLPASHIFWSQFSFSFRAPISFVLLFVFCVCFTREIVTSMIFLVFETGAPPNALRYFFFILRRFLRTNTLRTHFTYFTPYDRTVRGRKILSILYRCFLNA